MIEVDNKIKEQYPVIGWILSGLFWYPFLAIWAIGLACEYFIYSLGCEEYLPDTQIEIKQLIPNGFMIGS